MRKDIIHKHIIILVFVLCLSTIPVFSVDMELLDLDGQPPDEFVSGLSVDDATLSADELCKIGWVYHYYLQDDDESIKYFERALEKDENSVSAHEGLGIIDFMRGDMGSAFNHWIEVIEGDPGSLRGVSLASHLRLFRNTTPDYEEIPAIIHNLYRERYDELGMWASYRYKMLEQYHRVLNNGEKMVMENEIWDTGSEWELVGPFSNNGKVDYNYEFPPEKNPDMDRCEFDGTGYEWIKVEPAFDGDLILSDVFPDENGTVYLRTDIKTTEKKSSYMVIDSNYPVKIFLNGVQIYDKNSYKESRPVVEVIPVELKRGDNFLLVKTIRNYGLYSEAVDWRILLQVLKFDLGDEDSELLKPGFTADLDFQPFPSAYMALLNLSDGNHERAVNILERLVQRVPDYQFFRILLTYAYLWVGEEWQTKKARTELSTVIDKMPDCILAEEELAVFLHSEENYNKAIDVYKSTIDDKSDYVSAHMGLAETYWYKGYETEFLDELQFVKDIYPDNPRMLRLYGDYYYYNDIYKKSVDYYKRYLNLRGGDLEVREYLADCYEQLGELTKSISEYEKLQQLRPDNGQYQLRKCQLLVRLGEEERALELYEDLSSKRPWWSEVFKRKGLLQLFSGNISEGIDNLKVAVSLNPSDFWLRDFLEMNYLKEDEMVTKYDIEFDPDNIRPVDSFNYPGANSIMLYDQMIIELNDDYTFSEIIHNIIQIVNQEGRETWGEITIPSSESVDILEARTILPDGTILDAGSIKNIDGNYVISMEGLIPNSIIEIKYELKTELRMISDLKYFFSPPFIFTDIHIPFIKSQFVVVAPEYTDLYFVKAKFDGDVDETEENGKVIHSFTMEDINPIYPEISMPPLHKISPKVYVSSFDGVDKLFEWYRGELWGLTKLSNSNRRTLMDLIVDNDEQTRLEIARNAYYWVMANIQGNVGNIYYPADVNETFINRSGRPVDRAVLLMSIYDELGIDSELVLVNTTEDGDDIWEHPTSSVVDMPLVHIVDIEGKDYYLDVNIKDLAFGDYWSDTYGRRCVFIDEDGFRLGVVPSKPLERDFVELSGVMELDEEGNLVMEGQREYAGLRSSYRSVFKDPKDREPLVESSLGMDFSSITLTNVIFYNIDDKDKPFSYKFRFVSPYYGEKTKETITFPATPGKYNMTNAFIASENRKYPLNLNRFELYKDDVYIEIPDGYVFDYIPEDVELDENFGEYILDYTLTENRLRIERSLFLSEKEIEVDDYDDFIDFCNEIDMAEMKDIKIIKR